MKKLGNVNKYISEKMRNPVIMMILTVGFNIIITLILIMLQRIGFSEINVVVIYILSVLIISHFAKGYVYGIVSSVISMLSFNFFFIPPLFSFKVNDSTYIITFIVMLFSSIITSTQASKLIHSRELANEREKQSHILYRITSSLAKTSDIPEVATVAAQCLLNLFECDVTCIILDSKKNTTHMLTAKMGNRGILSEDIKDDEVNQIVSGYYSIPLKNHERITGFVCLPKELTNMDQDYRFLMDAIIIQITTAVERILLIRDKETAKSEMEQERFKSNLLRSISHDLRTPLTRITGGAEILRHKLTDEEDMKLAQDIYDVSNWLMRLIENILSLTRIQEGRMVIHKDMEAVEEIIAGAVDRISKYYPDYNIKITVPDEVLFVPMDGKLIEQVLINLISNAIEHSYPSDEIKVWVHSENEKVWFEISDKGSGIREDDLPKLFDIFFVSGNTRTDGRQGMGLGLTICKEIIQYHGGKIYAENNTDGGATFRFYLNKNKR